MRRLPKQRLYRGLMKAKMATPKDIPLIERKLADFKKYQQLNVTFTNNRGHRWANRLQSFSRWLWENREAILQILGLVIMFAEDGTPIVKDESEVDEETKRQARRNLKNRKPMKFTPHGEKVEDFTEPSDEVPTLDIGATKIEREKAEKSLDELTKLSQESGLYDIGLEDNPLVRGSDEGEDSGDEDEEVQPGEDCSEDASGHKSDDV